MLIVPFLTGQSVKNVPDRHALPYRLPNVVELARLIQCQIDEKVVVFSLTYL